MQSLTQPARQALLPLFDSRDKRFRAPFGAQPAGTSILFRLCLPRDWRCSAARLRVAEALPGGGERPLRSDSMFWAGMEGDAREWWDCHYAPEAPGVYHYWFETDTAFGTRMLARQEDGSAAAAAPGPGPRWQLTCYDPALSTPDWLAGGVMYQIFPDRFAKSGEPKQNVPADRVLREDWGGLPVWQPDETGEVRNNDYFGGDLKGIEQRLDYLAGLGVTCLYLNPVFEAHSNHRYDTADYTRIDPLLGTEEDFRSLVRAAAQAGIRVVLDGVFSHTGADSRYFNQKGRYPEPGAAQSKESPYFPWYTFTAWPDRYSAWWGFKTLPDVNETDPGFLNYITGPDGVARTRLREGAGGWRLDVADELPDGFLDALYAAAKAESPDAVVIGEVWEDASRKESYGRMRRYLLGKQMDSVMNYPFRDAVLRFVRGGDAAGFFHRVLDIVENYPPAVTRLLMNHIGTHDTERALTALAGEPVGGHDRAWQAAQALSPARRERGLRLLRLASALQFTLPGVPCIYYGDEAGMEGCRDPFNRGCYPWGSADGTLIQWYRRLAQLRRHSPALREGAFTPLYAGEGAAAFERRGGGQRLLCAVNPGGGPRELPLPEVWRGVTVSLGDGRIQDRTLFLPPLGCALAALPEDDAAGDE